MKGKRQADADYFICPNCGAEVKTGALACRECGADEETGWSETAYWDDADLSAGDEEDFEYEEFVRREFPNSMPRSRPPAKHVLVAVICVALLIPFLVPLLLWLFALVSAR